jgi:hypothetical protein
MPSAKSPFTVLGEALAQTRALKGKARVLVGSTALPLSGAPPRIVLFPRSGDYASAHKSQHVRQALRDIDQELAVHLWGENLDAAWELHRRFLQALEEQGEAAGLYWQAKAIAWDTTSDTAKQGQEILSVINVRLPVERVEYGIGEIDAVAMFPVTTLDGDIAEDDDILSVVSMFDNYPDAGVLHIDDEQMTYDARSGSQFTGLTRGANDTEAAAHESGAAIYVSET